MPLWKIYHPVDAFSGHEKQAIAGQIPALYPPLPTFYVGVVFEAVAKDSFFVGGEAVDDFVRISVDHIARTFTEERVKAWWLKRCGEIFAPYVADRGLRWELHIDETPFDLWTIQGLRPPGPDTAAEKRWISENRPSAYAAEERFSTSS